MNRQYKKSRVLLWMLIIMDLVDTKGIWGLQLGRIARDM